MPAEPCHHWANGLPTLVRMAWQRHDLGDDALCPFEASELRIGGAWQWSPDRVEWFPSSTLSISRGVFASSGEWQLVETNEEIVNYLDAHPVVPLVRREVGISVGVDESLWRVAHAGLSRANTHQVELLVDATDADEPTTPCVALRALTMHRYLAPPWLLRPRPSGWEAVFQSAAQASMKVHVEDFCNSSDAMTRCRVLPMHGRVRLCAWIADCEMRSRMQLGLESPDATHDWST